MKFKLQSNGWKSIVINCNAGLRKSNDNLLIIMGESSQIIPINHINTLIIESEQVTITSALMLHLIENNIKVIFCDKKHNPCFETIPYHSNTYTPTRLIEQIEWDNELKEDTWCNILRTKIRNQALLLSQLGFSEYIQLLEFADQLNMENSVELEARAAKIYFHHLFGHNFNRRTSSNINEALNYGYSIILSNINRIIIAYGYNTCLGLNHHNMKNHFNFSCDIIEPFRPFIDKIVFENIGSVFDKNYKRKLISVTSEEVIYNDSLIKIENALELFVLAILKIMNGEKEYNEVITFA